MAKSNVTEEPFYSKNELSKNCNEVNIPLMPSCKGNTGYANAIATVLHATINRNPNRQDVYPDWYILFSDIMLSFGEKEQTVTNVLKMICPKYDLRYEKVCAKEAIVGISLNRPIITKFSLTNREWKTFAEFYFRNPTGILTRSEIDINRRQFLKSGDLEEHFVVFTGYESSYLRFMNCWGEAWADHGFFKVQNENIFEFEFYDVLCAQDDVQR
ncbi:Hypothetical predicted protein [Mytilus galloprovincialis]|uniref:Peptidase C1A papain C-terminal domain-containing protein n=1 Tax=Mytilus galloprovincialis TaxID=29158 RepID=A0A8B6DTS4_MYTGA|nr:Hypothetical predicted protein [Mytilus galloprovincialis]